jgi:NitT/TauT family transport system ATP-binding protein
MDEPFGALDAITRARMQQFLLDMWERYHLTIVFVTHDIDEAILLSDRVALMGGKPARLTDVIENPLPRPRSSDSVDSAAALTVRQRIRTALTH